MNMELTFVVILDPVCMLERLHITFVHEVKLHRLYFGRTTV